MSVISGGENPYMHDSDTYAESAKQVDIACNFSTGPVVKLVKWNENVLQSRGAKEIQNE